jgi:hypothetical protein
VCVRAQALPQAFAAPLASRHAFHNTAAAHARCDAAAVPAPAALTQRHGAHAPARE